MGDFAQDFCELFEEWPGEIRFLAIVEWIPFISEPALIAMYGVLGFFGKNGYHVFVTEVAGAFV